jgi:hypothetical protein
MKVPVHPTLIRQMLRARVKKLAAQRPVLTASLVRIAKHCGRKGCRCQRGEKHVGHYLTFKVSGKTRTVYVPLDLVEDVRQWIAEGRRLKLLMKESSALVVALVATHVTERRRKAGRS